MPPVIEPCPVQLPLGKKVRNLESSEKPLLVAEADRVLEHELPVLIADLLIVVVLIGPDGKQKVSTTHAIELVVGQHVRRNEMVEPGEEVIRKGLVAAEAFYLGDEAEQPLRVACREYRHCSQKIRRMSNGLHLRAGRAFVRQVGNQEEDT
jgi:hypothetical protein